MLARELAIAEFDFARGSVHPDRLTMKSHGRYLACAEQMLEVYRQGVGRTRRELHRAVADVFTDEDDCPQRRIDALCKLLDDAGEYDRDRRGEAAALRREVFRRAAPMHPLVHSTDRSFENSQTRVKLQIADELGCPWPDLEVRLFADITEYHRLRSFAGSPDGRALLARYNVAQVQAALSLNATRPPSGPPGRPGHPTTFSLVERPNRLGSVASRATPRQRHCCCWPSGPSHIVRLCRADSRNRRFLRWTERHSSCPDCFNVK